MNAPTDLLAEATPSAVLAQFDCDTVPGPWVVQRATITEGLSRSYRLSLSLVTEALETDTDELVGRTCELRLERLQDRRLFAGVILRVGHRGIRFVDGTTNVLAVDLEVVPALTLLGQNLACRVFQDLTVPEILGQVLGGTTDAGDGARGLTELQRRIDTDTLTLHYEPPRDYCVQYRESDLAFASRLMHEEGIVYVFAQEDGSEVVRLFDDVGSFPVISSPVGGPLVVDASLADGQEGLTHFTFDRAASPTRALVRHYDWLDPRQPVDHPGTAFVTGSIADNDREMYLPSQRRIREVNQDGRVESLHDDSQRHIDLALVNLLREDITGRGGGNILRMAAGTVFDVEHTSDLPQLMVLGIVHEVEADTGGGLARYRNRFECIPATRFVTGVDVPPRPVMRGPQTATVTGPEGEEIHTDPHGRVRVRMHWDRAAATQSGQTSAWVRVSQLWAGQGWGSCFIPRVGMEVIVEFLDGDPDRPVVVGCLPNGLNTPPYPLPEEKTKATIKTRSSPGGQGYNELRFEDLAGAEEVYLRAERDFNELVRRNHGTRVQHDQVHHVGHDRTRTVGGHEEITVEGSRHIVVNGSGEGGFSGQSLRISSKYELDVEHEIDVRAPDKIEIVCQGSTITMTPDEITLHAGGGARIVLGTDVLIESSQGSRAQLDEIIEMQAQRGSVLTLEDDARLTSNDGAYVGLTSDAEIRSSGDGAGVFESSRASITSGQAEVTLDGATAAIEGNEVDVSGDDSVRLEGGGARSTLQGGNAGVN